MGFVSAVLYAIAGSILLAAIVGLVRPSAVANKNTGAIPTRRDIVLGGVVGGAAFVTAGAFTTTIPATADTTSTPSAVSSAVTTSPPTIDQRSFASLFRAVREEEKPCLDAMNAVAARASEQSDAATLHSAAKSGAARCASAAIDIAALSVDREASPGVADLLHQMVNACAKGTMQRGVALSTLTDTATYDGSSSVPDRLKDAWGERDAAVSLCELSVARAAAKAKMPLDQLS